MAQLLDVLKKCEREKIELAVNDGALEIMFDDAPSEELLSLLKQYKSAIIDYLSLDDDTAESGQIPKFSQESAPLSFNQKRLWFIEQLDGSSEQYNVPISLHIKGHIDFNVLQQSFSCLVQRHEILRTNYHPTESVQKISKNSDFILKRVSLAEGQQKSLLDENILTEISQPFDLANDLMLRATLFESSANDAVLLIVLHHIACDGWSLKILLTEFQEIYSELSQGGIPSGPSENIQYSDFAIWQEQQSERIESQADYWLSQLQDAPVVHQLPLSFPRPKVLSSSGAALSGVLSASQSAEIEAVCQKHNITPFMMFYTLVTVLFTRLSGESDIVIGAPVAGREHPQLQNMVGYFANTLALRHQIEADSVFTALLAESKKIVESAMSHQNYPFEKLVDSLMLTRDLGYSPLVQLTLSFHNTIDNGFALPGADVSELPRFTMTARGDIELSVVKQDGQYQLRWIYNTDLFSEGRIQLFHNCLLHIVEQILTNLELPYYRIQLTSKDEADVLLALGKGPEKLQQESHLLDCFDDFARRAPHKTAVQSDALSLDYQTLQCRVNELAGMLQEQGVCVGEPVAVCLDNSAEMLVSVLSIFRCGGVLLPLSPSQPPARIAAQLSGAEVNWVLTVGEYVDVLPLDEVDFIDVEGCADAGAFSGYELQAVANEAEALAYILYTSGSTGEPKGVMVGHSQLSHYLSHCAEYYTPEMAGGVVSTPLVFDATLTSLLGPLYYGGTVKLLPLEQSLLFPALRESLFASSQSWVYKLTPAHLAYLQTLVSDCHSEQAHCLVIGGEQLHWGTLDFYHERLPDSVFVNEYGPTESTVGCVRQRIDGAILPGQQGEVPIGRPINGVQCYVLDEAQQLVPRGVVGELYLGGAGLSPGYVGNRSLTQSCFPTGLLGQSRLYRTGDRVRYLEDGRLVFVGRSDGQVKLNGYRIELGEVEYHLQCLEQVDSALVRVHPGPAGAVRLVAYVKPVTAVSEADESSVSGDIRQRLSQQLPDYMLPGQIICVSRWPMTGNGKVDYNALPLPDDEAVKEYEGASNDTEQALVCIWSELLQRPADELSVTANFFELGGDSILSIQLVSRAAKEGLHFSVKDLFEQQTIRRLAQSVGQQAGDVGASQQVDGEVPLLPVQQHFFEDEAGLSHYNQSVLLSVPEELDREALCAIVTVLYHQHDSLRQRFSLGEHGWQSEYVAPTESLPQWVLDEVTLAVSDSVALSQYADAQHQQFSLSQGRLFRCALVQDAEGGRGRLLMVAHHLAVDGISWRILCEDLVSLYGAYQRGETLSLGDKGHSLQQWGRFLADEYAQSDVLAEQRDYWLCQGGDEANTLWNGEPTGQSGTGLVEGCLGVETTGQLLGDSGRPYRTRINELLLSGLLRAVNGWRGQHRLRLTLEGHGREALAQGYDLGRTTGWFTSLFPLVLTMPEDTGIEALICQVKEQCRRIPQNGIGYGVLRYLCRDEALLAQPEGELLFNYLGQFDQVSDGGSGFALASESSGQAVSGERTLRYGLALNGMVVGGALQFELSYDRSRYDAAQMSELMSGFMAALEDINRHCQLQEQVRYTPSDFPLAQVDMATLSRWKVDERTEDLYPATGLQQGMLFHSLLDAGSYVTQVSFRIRGLDVSAFRQSWEQVVAAHSVFRTALVGTEDGQGHQQVFRDVALPWSELDLTGQSEDTQNTHIAQFLREDKVRGFEVGDAPLMRMTVMALSADVYQFIWSHHHALLDGWSIPLVYGQVARCYGAIRQGRRDDVSVSRPYRDYVAWLAAQNKTQAQQYWREQLQDVAVTRLPLVAGGAVQGSEQRQVHQLTFSKAQTRNLQALAQTARTTMNIVVQGAWSLLLSRYGDTQQVMFGTTTSGRPAELPGVEEMVGLFINTVPVVVDTSGDAAVVDWLQQLHGIQVEREQHSYLPLRDIQQASKRAQPLFDSLLVFENYPMDVAISEQRSEFSVETAESHEGTNYAMTLIVHYQEKLSIRLEIAQGLLSEKQGQQLLTHLSQILFEMQQQRHCLVSQFDFFNETDHQILMKHSYQDYKKLDVTDTLLSRFQVQVSNSPNSIALVFEQDSLSYLDLDNASNALALEMHSSGINPGDYVAICLERSPMMVVALLAVLKAGCAYLPIDQDTPVSRISNILRQSGCAMCITDNPELIKWQATRVLMPPKIEKLIFNGERGNSQYINREVLTPESLAYVIFTSGSTGEPKGVKVSHSNVLRLFDATSTKFAFDSKDSWCHFHSLAFDFSVWEIWGALLHGGKLHVVPRDLTQDIKAFYKWTSEKQITVLNATPSTFYQFAMVDDEFSANLSLRKVIFGGESLSYAALKNWMLKHGDSSPELINMYGITETTIHVTYKQIQMADVVSDCPNNNIGKPVSDLQVLLLDKQLRQVPVGEIGELYIAGGGVSQGYVNNPTLTRERFITSPFDHRTLLYRSGDLARYDTNGELMYMGRIDQQISIRGFRVELGEVESALLSVPGVTSAAAIYDTGKQAIFAVYTSAEVAMQPDMVKESLAQVLPNYMQPSLIVALPSIPRTRNGKVDSKAIIQSLQVMQPADAKLSDTEESIRQLWLELLPDVTVDSNSNFFELGGHSLLLTRMSMEIEKRFNISVSIKEIFQTQSLSDLAILIEDKQQLDSLLTASQENEEEGSKEWVL